MKKIINSVLLILSFQVLFAQNTEVAITNTELVDLVNKADMLYKAITNLPKSTFVDGGPFIASTKGKKLNNGRVCEMVVISKLPYLNSKTMSSITFHLWTNNPKTKNYPRTTVTFQYKEIYGTGKIFVQKITKLDAEPMYMQGEDEVRKLFYELLANSSDYL